MGLADGGGVVNGELDGWAESVGLADVGVDARFLEVPCVQAVSVKAATITATERHLFQLRINAAILLLKSISDASKRKTGLAWST